MEKSILTNELKSSDDEASLRNIFYPRKPAAKATSLIAAQVITSPSVDKDHIPGSTSTNKVTDEEKSCDISHLEANHNQTAVFSSISSIYSCDSDLEPQEEEHCNEHKTHNCTNREINDNDNSKEEAMMQSIVEVVEQNHKPTCIEQSINIEIDQKDKQHKPQETWDPVSYEEEKMMLELELLTAQQALKERKRMLKRQVLEESKNNLA